VEEETLKRVIIHDVDKKQKLILGLTIFIVLIIGSAPVVADMLPVNRFPEIDDELIALKILEDSGCQEKIKDAGFANTQDFLDLANEKGYTASIGRVLAPIRFNKEEFKLVEPKAWERLESDDELLSFSFLEPKSKHPHQMIFYPGDQNVELRNGSDALIISMEEDEAVIIGIIDPAYALNTTSYDDLSNISISCYFTDSDNR